MQDYKHFSSTHNENFKQNLADDAISQAQKRQDFVENLKTELIKDAEDIVSQIDAFRMKIRKNLSSDENTDGALR